MISSAMTIFNPFTLNAQSCKNIDSNDEFYSKKYSNFRPLTTISPSKNQSYPRDMINNDDSGKFLLNNFHSF